LSTFLPPSFLSFPTKKLKLTVVKPESVLAHFVSFSLGAFLFSSHKRNCSVPSQKFHAILDEILVFSLYTSNIIKNNSYLVEVYIFFLLMHAEEDG